MDLEENSCLLMWFLLNPKTIIGEIYEEITNIDICDYYVYGLCFETGASG